MNSFIKSLAESSNASLEHALQECAVSCVLTSQELMSNAC
jgi:hypothetical protein